MRRTLYNRVFGGYGPGRGIGMGRRNRGAYCPWRDNGYPAGYGRGMGRGTGRGMGWGYNRFDAWPDEPAFTEAGFGPADEDAMIREELAALKARQEELEALLKEQDKG